MPSPQPLVLALALTIRGQIAFGFEFLRRIAQQLRAQLALQLQWSRDIRAIDDELEREFPLFVEMFQNDPPPNAAAPWRSSAASTPAPRAPPPPSPPPSPPASGNSERIWLA